MKTDIMKLFFKAGSTTMIDSVTNKNKFCLFNDQLETLRDLIINDYEKLDERQENIVNKLIEAYSSAIQSIDDYDCYERHTGKIMFKHEIFKWDLEFLDQFKGN